VSVLSEDVSVPPAKAPPDLRSIAAQAVALGVVLALAAIVVATTTANLRSRGIPLGLEFLFDPAGFSIAETLLPYDPADSAWWAVVVGVGNTLLVSVLVAVASTILGTFLGIARLSENPLVAGVARVWVEGARNTPPILLLIFLYTLWWQVFPADRTVQLLPGMLGSIRGLAIPTLVSPWSLTTILLTVVAAVAVLLLGSLIARRLDGNMSRRGVVGVIMVAVAAPFIALGLAAGSGKLSISMPIASGTDISGGATLTPELATILLGLTIYTTGFVAEIVRGGINAVPSGQWEAAKALGLGPSHVLRLVIIPQMMRVVVPPMTSQYINVVKNSTLALAVGYTDFLTVMGTMINKTSHAVEGTVIIIIVYLAINLSMSAVLNFYNYRLAVKER